MCFYFAQGQIPVADLYVEIEICKIESSEKFHAYSILYMVYTLCEYYVNVQSNLHTIHVCECRLSTILSIIL